MLWQSGGNTDASIPTVMSACCTRLKSPHQDYYSKQLKSTCLQMEAYLRKQTNVNYNIFINRMKTLRRTWINVVNFMQFYVSAFMKQISLDK